SAALATREATPDYLANGLRVGCMKAGKSANKGFDGGVKFLLGFIGGNASGAFFQPFAGSGIPRWRNLGFSRARSVVAMGFAFASHIVIIRLGECGAACCAPTTELVDWSWVSLKARTYVSNGRGDCGGGADAD